ncbi:hypothetical protein ABBQ32_004692 [Trebouxia sp. C0010 RCD-2024]
MLPIYDILLEPAWPSVVADHHPEDWPGSVAPAPYHQDLIYLSNEKALSKWGKCSAAPAAEQLVAEEAQEAAKAAAKKAKKQKASVRKQQARSEATSPTEPAAAPSQQAQPGLDPLATLHQFGSCPNGSAPDRDSDSQQLQLQSRTVQNAHTHAHSVGIALSLGGHHQLRQPMGCMRVMQQLLTLPEEQMQAALIRCSAALSLRYGTYPILCFPVRSAFARVLVSLYFCVLQQFWNEV